ncbi:MAG TPA: tRNA lysidine(34) synthetase TilS [Moraxellaceae bacterium]|nr:tRNA lysidine(34) synthetase TilS [Moraxellaceae bacterium]
MTITSVEPLPLQRLRQFLESRLAHERVRTLVVALSGGLDSRVLLHAAVRIAPAFGVGVRAIHVHHGLSPHADAWTERVAAFCAEENVSLTICRVRVAQGASLENAARRARLDAFSTSLEQDDALLLAQHRDDQAETVLFRLMRGTGLTGLGGMRADTRQAVTGGRTVPRWRPFLDLSRDELAAFAATEALQWVEDESNADTSLDRNFLRHEILPQLARRWPAAGKTLSDTALRLQEADSLLQELAGELIASCRASGGRLDSGPLAAMTPAQQRLVLRFWLREQGFLTPDAAVLERIRLDMMTARADAMPCVAWPGGEVRRYRSHLYVRRSASAPPANWSAVWEEGGEMWLPDGRRLVLEGKGAPRFPWQVRFRRGGERLRAAPDSHSRELKTWLQEQGIPPWERSELPLVFVGDELVAVGDLPWLHRRTWRLRLLSAAPPGIK